MTPRLPSLEWLDDPSLPCGEMAENLADIARLDRLWGGSALLARWLLGQPARGEDRRPKVLDLGAGSAAGSRRLRRALARAGRDADVIALDLQWRHLLAGTKMNGREPLPALAADALRLPLADASVDWVVSTLLLHHFSPGGLEALFAEIRRVARRGFVLLDLRRHRLPIAFLAVAVRFLFASAVSAHDALASARQAYTPEEIARILGGTGTRATVRRLFPFRVLVSACETGASGARP